MTGADEAHSRGRLLFLRGRGCVVSTLGLVQSKKKKEAKGMAESPCLGCCNSTLLRLIYSSMGITKTHHQRHHSHAVLFTAHP
jgi:hypothetical protein